MSTRAKEEIGEVVVLTHERSFPFGGDGGYDRRGIEDRPWKIEKSTWKRHPRRIELFHLCQTLLCIKVECLGGLVVRVGVRVS